MQIHSGIETVIGIDKNCSRCGKEFSDCSDKGLMRFCYTCKKPAVKKHRPELGDLGKPLTLRERQIIDAVVGGWENKNIAAQLHLTEGTIKTYLSKIFDKVGARNRTQLTAIWVAGRSIQQRTAATTAS